MKTQQCCVLSGALGTTLLGASLVVVSQCSLATNILLRFLEPQFAPAVLALGAAASTAGFVGAVGAGLASRIALGIYGVLTLLIAVTGFVIGGLLLALANGHGEEISRHCMMDQQTGQTWSQLTSEYQSSYDSMKEALLNCRRNGNPSALSLEDCGQLARDSKGRWFAEDKHRFLFAWIEEQSGCGGFCAGDLALFGFAEQAGGIVDQSNKQSRRKPCFNEVVQRLEADGDRSAGLIVGLSAPLFFAVCGALWIVCYPPPKSRKGYVHAPHHDSGESGRLLPAYRDPQGWSSDEDEGYVYPESSHRDFDEEEE
eukprot:gnl/TRDRNA2_/TRDRNA2_181087_c0_seq1.p1 gnl/TRDRNA2_/TRDRNA2_181087_c0~~gnl/TRDRNA2_/TRDRNA2_181087_c0_seq1.p1  ORF type:complete len:313 (-),score=55.67 gnl/TRDRNA2_/TRDRNA2_181087_c0_seq1:20-958(-)